MTPLPATVTTLFGSPPDNGDMGPVSRARFGIVLLWRSLRVVAANRRLVALPVLSWLAFVASAAAVAATFGGESILPRVVAAVPFFEAGPSLAWALGVADPVVAFVVGAVATTYFNAVMVSLSIRAMRYERASYRRAVVGALASLDRVVLWGILSSSVGPVFSFVEQLDPTGRLVSALVGDTWSSAALLVLPVIAFEDAVPSRLFERSRQLFEKTWGSTTGASLGVDLVLGTVVLAAGGAAAYVNLQAAAPAPVVEAAAVVVVAVVLLLRQLTVPVAKASLYIYATTGRTPAAFEDLDLAQVGGRARPGGPETAARPEP